MKILFAGPVDPGQTSHMRMRALMRLGHDVRSVHTTEAWIRAPWLMRQVQRRVQRGSIVDAVNQAVRDAAADFQPELLWAEKQEFLRPDTIEALRAKGITTIHFTPDPYFSLPWKRTRVMDAAVRAFDVLVYCKSYERAPYEALGKPTVYMPLGYCDEVHRPLPLREPRWQCGVGFLGGWEPRRENLLRALVKSGTDVKVFGAHWEFLRDGRWSPRRAVILRQLAGGEPFRIHRDALLTRAYQGGEVYADDYARALSGAAIGLGFLRKVCPDQHTTRTFEIPACGSLLLADRTAEHQALFDEGREAEFFEGEAELLDKVAFYTRHETARLRVAAAGRERGIRGRYAYVHRLERALAQVAALS